MEIVSKLFCGFPSLAGLLVDEAALKARKSSFTSGREVRGKHSKGCGTTRALLWCLLLTMLCDVTRADEPIYSIDIPSMNAAEALNRFAEQTGAIMLFSYDLASARRASAVRGRYTLLEGLELLLRGTGLSGGLSDKRVVNISHSGNKQRIGEEGAVLKQKTSFRTRITAFVASMFSVSAASGQDTDVKTQALEEIIVTAQKREERLQDVPISMSVLSGDHLDRSTAQGVTEALNRVPGVIVTVANQSGGSLIGMRGVSGNGALFAGSSPIGYYLDSAPFGLVKSALAPDSNAYDLDRIEVLRGPQGTLYGANAQNGVVRVLTHSADLDEFEFKARTSASSTEGGGANYRGDMAVNVPLIEDRLAVRTVVGYESLGGWVDRPNREDANEGTLRNYRLRVDAQPTDQLSADLSIWHSGSDYDGLSASNNLGIRNAVVGEPLSIDYDLYSLTLNYNFAAFSVTSMTSYLDYTNDGLKRSAFSSNMLFTGLRSEMFSEEVNLSSAAGRPFKWTAGAIYRDGTDRLLQASGPASSLPFTSFNVADYSDHSKSVAVFGEIGSRFFHNEFEWTLGVRYFHDDVGNDDNNPAHTPYHPRTSFDATTPRAVLTWYPHDNVTAYASYSEGFRSGFPQNANIAASTPFPAVEPDNLHNYEIGTKVTAFDERVSLDTAVYFIEWNGIQQTLSVPSGASFVSALVNAQSASGPGVDFALTLQPTDGLSLELNGGWNDLMFDSAVITGGTVLFNRGDRLNSSSEYTLGAALDYAFPLGSSGWEGRFSASVNYRSEQSVRVYLGGTTVLSAIGDPLTQSRVSFAVSSGSRWTTSVYADNLNNEDGAVVGAVPVFGQPDEAARLRPRTIGLQLEYRM